MLPTMILPLKSAPRGLDRRTATVPAGVSTPTPVWLRGAAKSPATLEDAALAAGAALGALDTVIRRSECWSGVWRQRLALAAAAVTARQSGRVEDEAGLRDAVLLARSGDDVGPGGHMLLAWRSLASVRARTLLSGDTLAGVIEGFGLADANAMADDLAGRIQGATVGGNPVTGAIAAFELIEDSHRRAKVRDIAPWVADAVLANGFGWPHAVPLICAELADGKGSLLLRSQHRETSTEGEARRLRLLAGYARAALRAVDLSADLGRRAEALLAVAPKLRAKGAATVVERLLAEDAVSGSQASPGISDRGLRRLFDRLSDLGGVRELSGRPTFRLYGL